MSSSLKLEPFPELSWLSALHNAHVYCIRWCEEKGWNCSVDLSLFVYFISIYLFHLFMLTTVYWLLLRSQIWLSGELSRASALQHATARCISLYKNADYSIDTHCKKQSEYPHENWACHWPWPEWMQRFLFGFSLPMSGPETRHIP